MWRRIGIWRRRRIWKARSRTDLLRNPRFQHFWAEAATDRFLLEQVEGYGKLLWERLEAVVDEHRFVHGLRDGVDWDGGESALQDWALSLDELIEGDLVEVTDGDFEKKMFALTHAGRSQLHSLRSAEQTSRRLKVAVWSLWIAVVALVARELIGLLYQTGVLGSS